MNNDRPAPKQYETWLKQLVQLRFEQSRKPFNAMSKLWGRKKFLAVFNKQDHLAALRKEDLLAALSKEDLLAALSKEDLLAALNKEDLLQYFLAELEPGQLQRLLVKISGPKSASH